jgi:hypothetical protein
MARQDLNLEFNTFVGGILTEANPINFPKGYTIDQENFLLGLNGTNRKRWGLDMDDTQTQNIQALEPVISSAQMFKSFIWNNAETVAGPKEDLLCTVQASRLSIWTIDDTGIITDKNLGLTPLSGSGERWSITPFNSKLVIMTSNQWTLNYSDGTVVQIEIPAAVSNSIDTGTGLLNLLSTDHIFIRDFEGMDEPGTVDTTRPAVLTDIHHYNLLNSGWTEANINAFKAASVSNVYPARSDNMNTGLDALTGAFNTAWVENANNGGTRVPGGRAIISPMAPLLFRRYFLDVESGYLGAPLLAGTSDQSEVTLPDVAEQFGRLFYLWSDRDGTSLGGSSKLMFSQAAGVNNLGKCHSINDPTSRDFNQPLPTDGGYIDISNMGSVFKIVPLKTRLIIFADSGIYELFSSQEIPTPQAYNIRKISEVVVSHTTDLDLKSASNPVVAEDTVFFLAKSGAYVITANTSQEESLVRNISDQSVQKLFNDLPETALAYAQSAYSSETRTVHWLYRSIGVDAGVDNMANTKDSELMFNIPLNAWTKNTYNTRVAVVNVDPTLNEAALGLMMLVELPPRSSASLDYPIGSRLRYIGLGDFVGRSNMNTFNTCIFKPTENTFYDFIQDATKRSELPGTPYTGFLQTGYVNAGDTQRWKQGAYIVPSFIRTEDGFTDDGAGNLTPNNESSCTISAWWDYVDDQSFPKANDPFEAYRYTKLYIPQDASDTFDYGQSVLTTKNRLAGRGRALSLRFESGPGKDCQLLGWGMQLGTNTKV